jgi:Asp-tRNA(Asn)/Glu-tRNA(Gln) amidotransferase A subunit family amidase
VPCGFVPTVDSRQSEVKLPVGLQIVGRPFEESIFDLAKIIEEI